MSRSRLLVAVWLVCAHVICDVTSTDYVTECPDSCVCYNDANLVGTIHEENGDTLVVDCSNLGLSALPDLSVLTSEKIHKYLLNMNQLTDIPDNAFAGHSIHYLTLADNPINIIGDLAFAGQDHLQFLSLSRTRIQMLPKLDYLGELRTLDLNAIPITELSETAFHGLGALEELVLSNILLTEIHEEALAQLTALSILRLEGCDLTTVPLAVQKAPNLINLHMDFNQLSTLGADYHDMPALRTLTLSGNLLNNQSLTETSFLAMPQLHKLDMSFNMLNRLPVEALPHLASLTVLLMPDNGITTIPDGAFHSQKSLKELSLSGNQVTLTPENVVGLEESLEELKLARTNLNADTVPLAALQKLKQLKHLDLSGNRIERTHDDMFTELPNLDAISLMRTSLVYMSEDTFRGLVKPLLLLDLNQNSLQNLSFVHDVKMFEKIELVGNPIHCACPELGLKYDAATTLVGTCGSPEDVAGVSLSQFLSDSKCDPAVHDVGAVVALPPGNSSTSDAIHMIGEEPAEEPDVLEEEDADAADPTDAEVTDADVITEEAREEDAETEEAVAETMAAEVIPDEEEVATEGGLEAVAPESEGAVTEADADMETEEMLVAGVDAESEAVVTETETEGESVTETETDDGSEAVVAEIVPGTDAAATDADAEHTEEAAPDAVITEIDETNMAVADTATETAETMTDGEETEVLVPVVNAAANATETKEDDKHDETPVEEAPILKNEDEAAHEMGLGLELTANSQLAQAAGNQTKPETETEVAEPPVLGTEHNVKAATHTEDGEEGGRDGEEGGRGGAGGGRDGAGGERGEPEVNRYTDSASELILSHVLLMASLLTVAFTSLI